MLPPRFSHTLPGVEGYRSLLLNMPDCIFSSDFVFNNKSRAEHGSVCKQVAASLLLQPDELTREPDIDP